MLCSKHTNKINHFKLVDKEELCETYEDVKIVPRSIQHVRSLMTSIGNQDDIVSISLVGGSKCVEDADISNDEYIVLVSDGTKYMYNPSKGEKKVKDIRLHLRKYCQNVSGVEYTGNKYCEDCYKKLTGVPKIYVVDKVFNYKNKSNS